MPSSDSFTTNNSNPNSTSDPITNYSNNYNQTGNQHYLWSDQSSNPNPNPTSTSLSSSKSLKSKSSTTTSKSNSSKGDSNNHSLYNQFKLNHLQEDKEERDYYANRNYHRESELESEITKNPISSTSSRMVGDSDEKDRDRDRERERFERENRNRDALLLSSSRKDQAETMLKVLVWHQNPMRVNTGASALSKTPLIREVSGQERGRGMVDLVYEKGR